MPRVVPWMRRRADDVAVLLLGAMFASFIVQIVSRYVLNQPMGWTLEMCLTTWLWTVFWASSFCLKHDDHIRFDMLYNAVGRGTRRVFAAIGAVNVPGGKGEHAFQIVARPDVGGAHLLPSRAEQNLALRSLYNCRSCDNRFSTNSSS